MTKYWTLFFFDEEFNEVWSSADHYPQSSTLSEIWKKRDMWWEDSSGGVGSGTYVYVELNEEDI